MVESQTISGKQRKEGDIVREEEFKNSVNTSNFIEQVDYSKWN